MESVTELQYFCGELSFEHLYDLSRWNFVNDLHRNNIDSTVQLYDKTVYVLRGKYGGHGPNCGAQKALYVRVLLAEFPRQWWFVSLALFTET